jgi:hypothetical protein
MAVTILDENNNTKTFTEKPSSDTLDNILAGYQKQMTVDNVQATAVEQRRGRGRPAGSTKKTMNKGVTQPPPTTQPAPQVQQPQHPGQIPAPTGNQPATIRGTLIGGYMFLVMIDNVLPMIINFIHSRYSKLKVNFAKLKLTEQQKKDLEPVSNDVVRELNINGNPIALMLLGLGSIYTMNYMLLVQQAERDEEINKKK